MMKINIIIIMVIIMISIMVVLVVVLVLMLRMILYIYIIKLIPALDKPLLLLKSRGPRQLINAKQIIPDYPNSEK